MSITNLPAEIVHEVIEFLDLKSVYHLALTNREINHKINGHRTYHWLTTNRITRSALKIFKQTSILPRHSLSTLTMALEATTCVCCNTGTAPYIYLLTAERACKNCIQHCPRFQLIPIYLASRTFALSTTSFKTISLVTIPGRYDTHVGPQSHLRCEDLVNAEQARALAASALGPLVLDVYMALRNIDATPYMMPLRNVSIFKTPLDPMSFRVCTARSGLWPDKWFGITGMGCEPWPFLWTENGITRMSIAPGGPVFRYRLQNWSGLFREQHGALNF